VTLLSILWQVLHFCHLSENSFSVSPFQNLLLPYLLTGCIHFVTIVTLKGELIFSWRIFHQMSQLIIVCNAYVWHHCKILRKSCVWGNSTYCRSRQELSDQLHLKKFSSNDPENWDFVFTLTWKRRENHIFNMGYDWFYLTFFLDLIKNRTQIQFKILNSLFLILKIIVEWNKIDFLFAFLEGDFFLMEILISWRFFRKILWSLKKCVNQKDTSNIIPWIFL